MIRRQPGSTRTEPLFPYTTLFRADSAASEAFNAGLPFGESADINECDLELASDRKEALLGQLLEFLERRQPREAMEFKAGSDPRTLRDAMGCFATGITIVTALDPARTPVGLTANSFTRSQERRVGQGCVITCSSRWSPSHKNKKNQTH